MNDYSNIEILCIKIKGWLISIKVSGYKCRKNIMVFEEKVRDIQVNVGRSNTIEQIKCTPASC
jgi:hypothetical protein